jgi:hypothetical protein
MPGRSGVTVVTNSRVFFYTRGCGRIERPAFPAPSDFRGERFYHPPGAFAPRGANVCVFVIASAAKQSIFLYSGAKAGLLRFARNDGEKIVCFLAV